MRLDEEVFEFDREDDEIESEYDTENVDAELSEQAQRQLLKEQQLIDELEADAAENPIEDDRPDEDSERKKTQTGTASRSSCPFGGCRKNGIRF